MFFAETWYKQIPDTTMKGYQLHRVDRQTKGGWVAIYTRDDLVTSEITTTQLNTNVIEQIWRIVNIGTESILLVCMHRPHDQDDHILADTMT
jgi:hypothetical protein